MNASNLDLYHDDLRIYIYSDGFWQNITQAGLHRRDDVNEILDNRLNNGAGVVIDHSHGAYHTDQYQLFPLLYHRAVSDPRRTLNPDEATTFIIPYDFANDCAYYKKCSKSLENVCFDFRKCPLAPDVELLLSESKYFQRNQGKDHLLVIGMNYAMDHYIGKPKCKRLLNGICRNCTKLAIDDYSFMYGDDQGIKDRGDYWHAIPFPADFHWTRYVKPPFPWDETDRPILVSYVGSSRSYYGPARRLRGSIIHYCELHSNECIHQSYGANGTRSSFLVEGFNPLQISSRSIFCFQPIGDLMTRKGLFDSLLQGCIPVVFDVLTSSVMYTWHWDESFWNEISVDLPFHPTAFRYSDPVIALRDLYANQTDLIKHKQRLIKERVFELQYSLDSRFYEYGDTAILNATENSYKVPENWPKYKHNSKPMRDAYDITMDLVLGWHSGRIPDIRNGTVPECWNGSILDKVANKCIIDNSKNSTNA